MADGARGVRERDIQGLKYFDQLLPLLERLHDVGRRHLLSCGHSDSGVLCDHRLPVDQPLHRRAPTLRSYEMVCLYLQGWADLDELTEHLESLPPHVAG